MEPANIPRMRTAPGVLEAIKAEDPETEISLNFIKVLIRTEAVPVLKVGKKKLVSVDDVLKYLAHLGKSEAPRSAATTSEVPRIPLRDSGSNLKLVGHG